MLSIKILFFATLIAATTWTTDARFISPFLIDGKPASPGQFPYLADISYNTRYDSAVLISDRHLIAKSLFLANWGNVTVILGAFFRYLDEPQQQRFEVNRADIIFKEPIQSGFDIAIIPLPKRAIFNERVQPVLLPRWGDKGLDYVGENGVVTDWLTAGERTFTGYDEVEIRPYSECGTLREPEELCVAKDLMSAGDNGAPLVVETEEGRVVVGIFSYYAIFRPETEWVKTNVFIRLNEHLDFIAENTGVLIRP